MNFVCDGPRESIITKILYAGFEIFLVFISREQPGTVREAAGDWCHITVHARG